MDALRSAGRALLRSPSVHKPTWAGGRHKKLPENWTDTRETLLEGMLFSLKYMGMTLVEQPKGEELSAAAVKRIVATAKASGKKLQKVTLKVSPRGIVLRDSRTNELIENISIYRISYCTADKAHDKVFAYIAQSQLNESLECHAFLCTKRKMAQAVTLTVAQAFRIAFEFWQAAKEGEFHCPPPPRGSLCCVPLSPCLPNFQPGFGCAPFLEVPEAPWAFCFHLARGDRSTRGGLAELPPPGKLAGSDGIPLLQRRRRGKGPSWQQKGRAALAQQLLPILPHEMDDGLDEAFSRLAQSRTNPQLLDTGLSAQDVQGAGTLSPVALSRLEPARDDPSTF
ncbi:hypothetical protein DV515_00015173 [Chloebia gouldiae]|uniref:PID domain-containing protein n=1 Tax=Chloebia gouldiae TaxID=44316 RepID=A0A3L8RVZ5_CHLGU|nr:hypothetical protein DV515_00015173 [Chloebia gouldiae]